MVETNSIANAPFIYISDWVSRFYAKQDKLDLLIEINFANQICWLSWFRWLEIDWTMLATNRGSTSTFAKGGGGGQNITL